MAHYGGERGISKENRVNLEATVYMASRGFLPPLPDPDTEPVQNDSEHATSTLVACS